MLGGSLNLGQVKRREAVQSFEVVEKRKKPIFSPIIAPASDIRHLDSTKPGKPMNTTLFVDNTHFIIIFFVYNFCTIHTLVTAVLQGSV